MSEQATALPSATEQTEAPAAARGRRRRIEQLRAIALGLGFPILLVLLWDRAVAITGTRLVPSPRDVAVMMYDFSFGGVYDDAFSATILTHIWKSMTRVYGGFFLAALIGIPLGLMIGRVKLLRQLLDPTINLLRPIPVTAWLPLSMIFFGLGPNAAIFLVFLGAFYPILLNTIFGVRSVDVRLHWLRHVPPGGVSRLAAGDLQWASHRPWLCLDPDRGGGDDRGADRARLGDHG